MDALFAKGSCHYAMGEWEVAVELYDRVLAIHPHHV